MAKKHLEADGYEVKMIAVNSVQEFKNAWSNITGYVDYVIIISHANERSIILKNNSSTEALSVNGLNKAGVSIGDIRNLEYKMVKNLELYCCNAGQLDYYNYSDPKGPQNSDCGNVASVFSQRICGTVKAYDGSVSFGPSGFWSIFNFSADYSPRLATNQTHFYELNEQYGTESRDPVGAVYYKDGRLLP